MASEAHSALTVPRPCAGSSQPLCISAQALASLSSLPCLESIDIQFDRLWGNAGDLVAWSTLCTLTALKVDCRMESALMHPDALSVLSMLRSLTLSNVRVPQISPAMVSALSLVSRLDLSGILAAKPRRKSGFTLWHALRGLSSLQYLSIADVGQAAEMPWTAFACTGLRGLTLLSISRLGRWPDASCEGGLAQLRALEELHLEEVGLMELPGPVFWQHVPALTSLCWRAVRSCPQHQHPWRPGDPLLLPAAAAPVLSKLKTLRLEYDGAAGRFTGVEDSSMPGVALPAVIASCRALRYLSLEGQSHCQAVSVLDVRHLTALTRVSLDNCALTHVPLGVVEHPGLAELSLLNNPGLAVDEYVGARLGRIPQVCRNDPQALLEKAQRGLAAGSIGAE